MHLLNTVQHFGRIYGRDTTNQTISILFISSIANDVRYDRQHVNWCNHQKDWRIYEYQSKFFPLCLCKCAVAVISCHDDVIASDFAYIHIIPNNQQIVPSCLIGTNQLHGILSWMSIMMSGSGLYVIYRNKEINHFSHVRAT